MCQHDIAFSALLTNSQLTAAVSFRASIRHMLQLKSISYVCLYCIYLRLSSNAFRRVETSRQPTPIWRRRTDSLTSLVSLSLFRVRWVMAIQLHVPTMSLFNLLQ